MTRLPLIVLAASGSAALLAGAFLFQVLGYAPCQMCLWQRWPHAVAIAIGLIALATPRIRALLAWAGAAAAAITAGLGFFHTGVEKGWWEGPSSCSGGGLEAVDGADLLSTDIAPIVMCSDVVWSLFGLSMASYNGLISLALALIWIIAARRPD
ncbi:disulfide bond formation protein B [Pseudooctadecabacter jejudonensis]|uniref:Disulfide bond formation protein B n=1 Tax=Pseudooctadecabacter jejudonensis TaxID=1391910 RepID=A0A1Y5RHU1_9RHOB|nr:disulfide bond formation protein B [Pseudooctadecabacter jejudonensis]SLN16637.1 Disulfide bond formation protein B [Pseudooctadecabacter jejudonensis]